MKMGAIHLDEPGRDGFNHIKVIQDGEKKYVYHCQP